MLRCKGLVKVYRNRRVVDGVSLQITPGEIVGLLGPNGAGKTTTFYMITGLIPSDDGEIYLDDQPIGKLPMYKRARMGIGYLPQEPSIFRRMSVEDNIMAILETLPLKRSERKKRLEELLEELDLAPIRKSKGFQLSGGERRRVEITRALVTSPRFMLLDEPFAGVDPIAVEEIQKIIRRLQERGIGVVITDHNVRETLAITGRSYIIHEGHILTEGDSNFLAHDPEARKIYLGENFKLDETTA